MTHVVQEHWLATNAARAAELTVITENAPPLGTAEQRARAMGYRGR